MAVKKNGKSSEKGKIIETLNYSVKVEVREPEFEPLSTLQSLNTTLLATGNHKIEIGFVHGGCCKKMVYAIIKKGMIVQLEVAPCKDSATEISKEMQQIIELVRRRSKAKEKWKPIPVKDLANHNTARKIRIGAGAGCVYVCAFSKCVFCCVRGRGIDCWSEGRKPDVIM